MARLAVFCPWLTVLCQCFLFIQCTDKIFITDVEDSKIFVGENSGFDFHGEDIREIPLSGVDAPTGIDYDYRTDKIYWSDESARTINRASLDGSNQEILIGQSHGIGHPQGIVLDLMTNRMFWTDSLLEQIVSASVLGSSRRTIISTGLYIPRGITLSQKRGKLYWTDQGLSTGKIEMSNKDGSDRRELITTRLKEPNGLALDSQEQRLYWTESYYDVIESIDLDDLSDRRDHVYAATGDIVVFGISLYFTSIYFTDFASRGLHEADIGVVEIRDITGFTAGAPTHVKIYADLTCPVNESCPGNSRCQLVAYNTPECICIVGWKGLNCLTRVTCTLPSPPSMASFVDPSDSYTASTTVTVTCDNGNDQAEWICNAFKGNWDKEPIDCSDQSSDQSIAIYAGIGGGVSIFVLLLFICTCVYWTKRKPQRSSVADPVQPAAPPMSAVYTAGAQPGVVTVPHATSSVNQTVPYHPSQSVAMPGNQATSSVNQTVPYYPAQAGAMPGNHATSSVNQTVPYYPVQSGAMPGDSDKKQLESEYEISLDAMNGPTGAAAYPGQYPGQSPGMQPGAGAPPPYFTNPQN